MRTEIGPNMVLKDHAEGVIEQEMRMCEGVRECRRRSGLYRNAPTSKNSKYTNRSIIFTNFIFFIIAGF